MNRSPIWKIPRDKLDELVKTSNMFTEILKFFGLSNIGCNFRTLKRRLDFEGINYAHIPQGLGANRGRSVFRPEPIPIAELFVCDSKYSRNTVRKRIIDDKLIEYKCIKCGLGPEWCGEPLVLILDHINGKRNDHRFKNLRFLCPNCDHQTLTFGSKNIKKRYNCKHCGKQITKHSKTGLCNSCSKLLNNNQRKVLIRPSKEELEQMIKLEPVTRIANRYGVSDRAIYKWCERYGIKRLGVGYWAKTYGVGNACP